MRVTGVITFVLITALNLAGLALTVLADEPLWPNFFGTLLLYTFAIVGVLIALRRPGNKIAWLCLTIGIIWTMEGVLWAAAFYGLSHPGTFGNPELLASIGDALVMPALFLMATLLLLSFPDGHLPSPRWRWVARLSAISIILTFALGLFEPETSGWGRPALENPLAGDAVSLDVEAAFLVPFFCVFASVAALLRRYRSSVGVERLQLKWLVASGVGAALIWLVIVLAVEFLLGEDAGERRVAEDVAVVATILGFALVPTAMGVAVLRYRLFEIDRLISRTLSYAVVVGALVAVYTLGIIVLGNLSPLRGDFAVAASTLAVAGLFYPIRRRVQLRVDRHFNRSRYNADLELRRFTDRLRDELDLEQLTDDLLAVVATTLQPKAASVWIREHPDQ
jgi:hypothetical protein